MSTPVLQVRDLRVDIGERTVLQSITLDVQPGSLTVLMGANGSGKSTLLNQLAGLEKPSEGQIFIDGEDVTHRSIQQRDICMVFQSYALFPHMSQSSTMC